MAGGGAAVHGDGDMASGAGEEEGWAGWALVHSRPEALFYFVFLFLNFNRKVLAINLSSKSHVAKMWNLAT